MLKRLLQTVTLLGTGLYFLLPLNSNVPRTPPATVPQVDINRYSGTWYQIASIPMFFQRGCVNTKATYSLNPDKTIKVENDCYSNGAKRTAIGKAVPEDNTGSKLKVSFPTTFGIQAPYWIVRLGKDYEYSVVSQPDYKYIWILSREPVMSEELYKSLIDSLAKDGFPVDRIVRTQQNVPQVGKAKGLRP